MHDNLETNLRDQPPVTENAPANAQNNPETNRNWIAPKTIFKKRIVHGMLGASLLSKVFGTIFPGEGTIYLNQTLNFLKPMYVDEKYEAIFEVKEIIKEKNRAIVSTTITNSEGVAVLSGEAIILNPSEIK